MKMNKSALRAYVEVLALFLLLLLEDVILVALFSVFAGREFYTEFREGRLRPPLSIIYVAVLYSVVLLTIILYWHRLSGSTLRDCGHEITALSRREFGEGSIVAAIAFVIFFGVLAASGAASLASSEIIRKITPFSFFGHVALNALVCFALAWTEELFFRGVVMHIFLKRVTALHAVIATSALFALCHMFSHGSLLMKMFFGVSLFLLGVILALMVLRTGHLWMSIGFHSTLIFLSMLKDYFQVLKLQSGPWAWLYGLSSNPQAGLWSMIVFLSVILYLRKIPFVKRSEAKEHLA